MTPQADSAAQDLAMALGRVPSGLAILTASQGERETGMLVSWVQQCSFEPPQVSVAVRRGREVLAWLKPDATFMLNFLAEGQTGLLGHFGKGFTLDQPAFTGQEVERAPGKPPVLAAALAHLECRVVSTVGTGDHELVIATVVAGKVRQPDVRPYVHVRKNGLRY